MKKHLSTIILVFVFLVGLSVVLYPTVSDYWNSRTQTRAIAAYQESMKDMKQEDYTSYFEAAEDYDNRLRETPGAFTDPSLVAGYEDTLDISGTGVMGYITIEKIGVELPIYHGTEEGTLQIAAGHLEGSSLPIGGAGTHAVISAHRGLPSAKLFTNLDELEKGDTFTITVMNRVLTYEVDQIAIVEPEDTEKLQIVDGAGLLHPADLHAVRHQHTPSAGAWNQNCNNGKAADLRGSRSTADGPASRSTAGSRANAADSADLPADSLSQKEIEKESY